jgi:CheY-like chemotaxis protein
MNLSLRCLFRCSVSRLPGTEAVRILRTRGCKSIICGLSANNLATVFEGAGADMFYQKPLPHLPSDLTALLVELSRKRRDKAVADSSLTIFDVSERSDDKFAVRRFGPGEEEHSLSSESIPQSSHSTIFKVPSFNSFEKEDELPQHLSVLFCDDDRTLRRLAMRALTNILPDCRVREASNGENALRLCESEGFDLIFMDYHMISSIDSVLSGSQTVQELRRLGCKSIIIGLSANHQEDAFLTAGANHFWLKPFPCHALTLRRALVGVLAHDQSVASIEGIVEV